MAQNTPFRADDPVSTTTTTWNRATSHSADSAVSVYELHGEIDAALTALAIAPIAVGSVQLRTIVGVDDALCLRPTQTRVLLSIHGGIACARAMEDAIAAAGIEFWVPTPVLAFPEASSPIEAYMLSALSTAHSARAVQVLLAQPEKWKRAMVDGASFDSIETAPTSLDHLLVVPTVAVVGAPNIGKSSLVNALAGRDVAITFDQPGTTRDSVSVRVECDGIVVDFVDCPGLYSSGHSADPVQVNPIQVDPIQKEAQTLAMQIVSRAALVLSCSDTTERHIDKSALPADIPVLAIGTRSDMRSNMQPSSGATPERIDLWTSATQRTGIDQLAALIRSALIPDTALASALPWRFWDAIGLAQPCDQ